MVTSPGPPAILSPSPSLIFITRSTSERLWIFSEFPGTYCSCYAVWPYLFGFLLRVLGVKNPNPVSLCCKTKVSATGSLQAVPGEILLLSFSSFLGLPAPLRSRPLPPITPIFSFHSQASSTTNSNPPASLL